LLLLAAGTALALGSFAANDGAAAKARATPAAKGKPAKHAAHGASKAKSSRAKSAVVASRRDKESGAAAIPLPRPRPELAEATPDSGAPAPTAAAAAAPALSGDPAALKQTLELARRGKIADATAAASAITDPLARRLGEWLVLRHGGDEIGFARLSAFVAANPDWPGLRGFRARAEAKLWHAKADPDLVRSFAAEPAGVFGRLALARARLASGDSDGARRLVSEAWRSEALSERLENDVLTAFAALLGADDHRIRMDRRLTAGDGAAALRAARRAGPAEVAIVKACAALRSEARDAATLVGQIEGPARDDLGLVQCRLRDAMRRERFVEAARLVIAAKPDDMAAQDTDEWWRQRRVLARKLLDRGEPLLAYQVLRDAAAPANPNYRAEAHFMPGWIALRYLDEPASARAHFALIDQGSRNPIVLARGAYWRGRAAEALGDVAARDAAFRAAAAHPTAYYGQLARARLGHDDLTLRAPRAPDMADGVSPADDLVRAATLLYDIGEPDLVYGFAGDLAERSDDVRALAALGDLARERGDARTMLQIGKTALTRGLSLDTHAFPDIGIPEHRPIGPPVERSLVYAVARTESAFDQRDASPAKAVGLMQVTPDAGRDTARRFGVSYDWGRLVKDPVYNTQIGAAELAALLQEYRGSHIMTFAGYNAGRGRVRDWIKLYGDPRRPDVDPVDWVERIPFAETRNYVQRVMENLIVYRVRLAMPPPKVPAMSVPPPDTPPRAPWAEVNAEAGRPLPRGEPSP
jgi:soluble lytic murein transglycosylase